MLRKIGLILLSLCILSTGCAQAFSLSSVTQNIPVSRKHVLYGTGALSLLLGLQSGRVSKSWYSYYMYWQNDLQQNNNLTDYFLSKSERVERMKNCYRRMRNRGIASFILTGAGAGMLYKAYKS